MKNEIKRTTNSNQLSHNNNLFIGSILFIFDDKEKTKTAFIDAYDLQLKRKLNSLFVFFKERIRLYPR